VTSPSLVALMCFSLTEWVYGGGTDAVA
jgi:hypothetical protein